MIPIRRDRDGLSFEVTVQPRASRAAIEGERGGALKIRLTAPPVDGSANRQCVELLAKALRVPKSAVEIVSGKSSKRKRVRIRHGDASAVAKELALTIEKTS
ncbi:DUF167 domain-containing protein [Nitrospinota bacterium]